jgi:hypothetical protein
MERLETALAHPEINARRNPADFIEAQEYLIQAVRLDPKSAVSWALLSHIEPKPILECSHASLATDSVSFTRTS